MLSKRSNTIEQHHQARETTLLSEEQQKFGQGMANKEHQTRTKTKQLLTKAINQVK